MADSLAAGALSRPGLDGVDGAKAALEAADRAYNAALDALEVGTGCLCLGRVHCGGLCAVRHGAAMEGATGHTARRWMRWRSRHTGRGGQTASGEHGRVA